MIRKARNRDAVLEGRRILVVEDDVRNVYSLTSILEPRGAHVQIARNGREAIEALEKSARSRQRDRPRADGRHDAGDGRPDRDREDPPEPRWKKLPIIMLTAKAMPDDQERCLDAGANDYMAKPLDVEKLLSLVRVWMPTTDRTARCDKTEDIEIRLLLEALFQKYHYDFRDYAHGVDQAAPEAGARASSALRPASRPCRTGCCTIRRCCRGCSAT